MMIDTQVQRGNAMTVDIRLCGNLTRTDVKDELYHRAALCPLGVIPTMNRCANVSNERNNAMEKATMSLQKKAFVSSFSSLFLQNDSENDHATKLYEVLDRLNTPTIEIPSWAEPARGEARLEPICDSVGRQVAVDLTTKSSFRLGRSPYSDIQLQHATSSRRHAILFHHSNGSCYIVDCGSAHGTFINGKRVSPPCNGIVVPEKVRKGSIVRFGGPGSPCFILKSFASIVEDRPGDCSDVGILVRRNTRLNATGDFDKALSTGVSSFDVPSFGRKRSVDATNLNDLREQDHFCKRMRCSSPPPSPEEPIRLVSPELSVTRICKPRRVTFAHDLPLAY